MFFYNYNRSRLPSTFLVVVHNLTRSPYVLVAL